MNFFLRDATTQLQIRCWINYSLQKLQHVHVQLLNLTRRKSDCFNYDAHGTKEAIDFVADRVIFIYSMQTMITINCVNLAVDRSSYIEIRFFRNFSRIHNIWDEWDEMRWDVLFRGIKNFKAHKFATSARGIWVHIILTVFQIDFFFCYVGFSMFYHHQFRLRSWISDYVQLQKEIYIYIWKVRSVHK